MEKYINLWGLHKWYFEYGEYHIHPQDLERYKERFFVCKNKLFFCVNEGKEYLTLMYKYELFRVKPDLFKPVRAPWFSYGDIVHLRNHPEKSYEIDDIRWDGERNEPYYFLIVNGKRKNKWCYEDEFIFE